jgi:hypothetical protein
MTDLRDIPIKVKVDGDAAGGWLVEIHDGDHLRVYSPDEGTVELPELAADHAEQRYLKEFPGAEDRLFERTLPVVESDPDEDAADAAAVEEAAQRARQAAEAKVAKKRDGRKRTRTETAKAPTVDGSGTA